MDKKGLTQNAMMETYQFVNTVYWLTVACMLGLNCTTIVLSLSETKHIKLALLHAETAASFLLLLVLFVARLTTELKVLTIMACSFFGGICLCTISLLDFF
tara:strand:+ start:2214 stop:2516 length:303 start_codon:yes stop_codon:yes gene_type:complete